MKPIALSIVIAVTLIGVAFVFTNQRGSGNEVTSVNNVSIIDGRQVIEIKAKGGYQPRRTIAKSGIPTVLRFDTNGTFDCSSAVRIPRLGINKMLPSAGRTDVDLGSSQAGRLQGMCSMGMYPFEIDFQN